METLLTSRYNFCIPEEAGSALVYNSGTGAVLRFTGKDGNTLARLLGGNQYELSETTVEASTWSSLKNGGFLVPRGYDELAEIRDRYWAARNDAPVVVTITTTMDCNLGCYYCYQTRQGAQLGADHLDQIVDDVRCRLTESGKRSLHVDWYGGEPLLNLDFLDRCSTALQAMCREMGRSYAASIISNGTCWPDGHLGPFVERHRIRQVQISFDGMRENHNKRRRYRARTDESSFDEAVHTVDRLLDHVRVDIRMNVDSGNQNDLEEFIGFAQRRGWFERSFPAVLQPARLAAYSEKSSFLRARELSVAEFDAIRGRVHAAVNETVLVEESEAPDGFPFPKTSVCAALARDSAVVSADGKLYRCGLQVGEAGREVGSVDKAAAHSEPRDAGWWRSFDPTTLPNCSRCSFLPVCWGGCPKKHLEGDLHSIAEQSAFWRANLARLVTQKVGSKPPSGFVFTEVDQFRSV